METVKQSGFRSSLGSHGCYVFSLLASAFTLVLKLGIMKFWIFKLMSIGPLGTNFSEILIKIPNFFHENAFENIICQIAAILLGVDELNLTSKVKVNHPHKIIGILTTLHLWSKFGDPSLNRWWVMVLISSKWGKFWLFMLNLALKVMINHPWKQ